MALALWAIAVLLALILVALVRNGRSGARQTALLLAQVGERQDTVRQHLEELAGTVNQLGDTVDRWYISTLPDAPEHRRD